MSSDNITVNDTKFHPTPGYMLVELFMPDKIGTVVLPNSVKDERQPELETVIVLEHNGKERETLAPGTRIYVKGGALITLIKGRKFSVVDELDVLGVFDK